MSELNERFTLEFENATISVEQIQMPGQVFFKVVFPDNRAPLTLLRAMNANQVKFWTSMPQGRQKLAEDIGPHIEQFYRNKRK